MLIRQLSPLRHRIPAALPAVAEPPIDPVSDSPHAGRGPVASLLVAVATLAPAGLAFAGAPPTATIQLSVNEKMAQAFGTSSQQIQQVLADSQNAQLTSQADHDHYIAVLQAAAPLTPQHRQAFAALMDVSSPR